MRKYLQPPPRRRLLMNYIGGLGYYGWLIAGLLIVAQLCVRAAQYLLPLSSTAVPDVSMTSSAPQANAVLGVGVLWNMTALLLMFIAILGAFVMPYYVGWLLRKLPRWIVAQTNYPLSLHILHRVKQIACLITTIVATALLFAPYESGLTNALYMATLAILFVAMGCFWLQNKIVTLWHVPERDVF